jgi:signal transduction histidine kinase/ActR/RegA family two-component response regulator
VRTRWTRSPPAAVRSRPGQWWLNRSVRVKGTIVVAIPLIALLAVTVASLVLQHNERQERSVALTAAALNTAAQQVLSDAVNAETGVRGYAATRDPLFLQPYKLTLTRIAGDLAALRAAAIAEGDSRAERVATTTTTTTLAELARLRSAVSAGVPAMARVSAWSTQKATMDRLRSQIAALAKGPAAIAVARRADIIRVEATIDRVSLAGLALGLLAGVFGIALFASGISSRVTVAAANADRLGEGQPLEPVGGAADELGRLADSLVRAEKLLVRRTTEMVTARDKAVTATQAKNAFLSSTSHELRSPLNAVLGFAQLLQLSDLNREDRDAVERILVAGRHLLALINELIDIARIESGDFSLSVEPVAVQPVIEETCQLMATLAADRSITISRPESCPGLATQADRQRLKQILINLVSNGIKYNRAGGTVTITCQAPGPGEITLEVADTGPGIQAADLERVFDPFERLGAEQTAIEGTGSGLPLARAFAQAMPGRLTARSVPVTARSVPGEGATFTRILPRTGDLTPEPSVDQLIPLQRVAPEDLTGTRMRILYIEDNPANIEVVSRFMKTRPDMRLRSVTSGQAGLEAVSREIPSLILLDLHLPGMHGDEVLRRLRANPATADIPVAILSAEAAPSVIRRMRASGVIAYLTKPLDLTELGELLDSVAAGHFEPGHDESGHFEPGHFEPGHFEPGHFEPGYYEPGYYEPGHFEPGPDSQPAPAP